MEHRGFVVDYSEVIQIQLLGDQVVIASELFEVVPEL